LLVVKSCLLPSHAGMTVSPNALCESHVIKLST
jgi:hypothetical protein